MKRLAIAAILGIAGLVLIELANPFPACDVGLGWWRCVQFELAAPRAAERTAELDAIEHQ